MMRWSTTGTEDIDTDVVVNVASRDQLMKALESKLEARQGFSLATLNLDHVVKLRKEPAFRKAYQQQTFVTADGNPIVWFSRLAGNDVSLVPGSELIEPVIALAVAHQVPIALFGATDASLNTAKTAIEAQFPGVQVAATLAPPMGFDPTGAQADAFIKDLKASGAGLCFIALGAPKQEKFAVHASPHIPSMGFLSIGAGLDFISKEQVRAPKIIRVLTLEWLWRLSQNPRRLFKRYMGCIAVMPSLLVNALTARRKNRS